MRVERKSGNGVQSNDARSHGLVCTTPRVLRHRGAAFRFVDALLRRREPGDEFRAPTRTDGQFTAATGAFPVKSAVGAGSAEGALEGANPRFGGSRWQI